jgi:hypothetical protein
LWSFGAGLGALRYALPTAVAGGVLAIVAWIIGRRQGVRTGGLNALALVTALLFAGYLGTMIFAARSVPAIHDVATNLDDLPQFSRLTVRADNLDKIPDQGRAELKAMPPEERWKALHRQAYGDLRPLRLARRRTRCCSGPRRWLGSGAGRSRRLIPPPVRWRRRRRPCSSASRMTSWSVSAPIPAVGRIGRRHALDQSGRGQRHRGERETGPPLPCRPPGDREVSEWTIGIVGGSGIYAIDALEGAEWIDVETPVGGALRPVADRPHRSRALRLSAPAR